MKKDASRPTRHLFIVRIWSERLGDDHAEWRGKVQHIPTGKRHYFRDWPRLIAYIREILADEEPPPSR